MWAVFTFSHAETLLKSPAVFQQLKWPYKRVESAALTGGLVTDAPSHAVLPTVPPLATFLLTLLAMLVRVDTASHLADLTCLTFCARLIICLLPQPALYFLWRRPSTTQFILGISQCGMCSFMFGWHVHEKAILLVLIPLRCAYKVEKTAKAELVVLGLLTTDIM